jgi:PAS domain S-box-containing protein
VQAILGRASPLQAVVGVFGFIPFNGGAAIVFLAASRAARDPRLRRGFLFYAAAFGLTAVGTLFWYWQQDVQGVDPTYSWINVFYLLGYPLIIAGILSFPIERPDASRRLNLLLDGAIAVVAGVGITWLYVVLPLANTDHDPLHRVLLFAYPIGDMITFAVMVPLLLTGRWPSAGPVLRLLAVGQLVYLAGDFGYQLGGGTPTWLRIDWPELAYVAGYSIMIWAAEGSWRAPIPAAGSDAESHRNVPRNLLPLLLGPVVYVLLLLAALRTGDPTISILAVTAVVVTMLILARETLTDRQNVRLARALEAERSEIRFRNVIRHLKLGVMVQDAESRLRLANQAAYDLLGLTEEELLGRSSFDPAWSVVHDDGSEFPAQTRPVPMAIATRRPVRNVVLGVFRPRTQDRVWLLVNAEPELRPDGEVEEVISTLHDITERRALEAQLRQAQRMEAVGQLAGGIAHDFNNLLTAITGYTALIQESLEPNDPRAEDVEEVRKAAVRAAALTQQLLAFGRRQLLQPVVLDINLVVREAERLLRRLLGEDIAIETRLSTGVGRVLVDRGQLEQVIVNLAVNARDAMPRGGTLVISTRNADAATLPPVAGRDLSVEGAVVLQVSDSGTGMDEATRARAFEPFFTTKEIGKGTGLGLSTVYGIVRQSGGDVWIESEIGKGTVVTVSLPRSAAPEVKAPKEAPVITPGRGHETILVVEDEAALRRVIRRVLEGRGYTVLEAGAPGPARDLLASVGPVDLLISDVVMPGGSGPELAAWARERQPGLPVLFITGYADEATMRYGLDLANATMLPKPFRPEQLAAEVREALDRRP